MPWPSQTTRDNVVFRLIDKENERQITAIDINSISVIGFCGYNLGKSPIMACKNYPSPASV